MTPEPNFEDMSFKPFTVNEHSTINPELDPDTNFFENISFLDTKYSAVNETKTFVSNIDSESFTVLHLNIRSIKKNFESFQKFFKDLKFNFSAVCLSETWCESIDQQKIPITNLIDIDLFIKLGTSAKEEGSVFFYVNLTLIN